MGDGIENQQTEGVVLRPLHVQHHGRDMPLCRPVLIIVIVEYPCVIAVHVPTDDQLDGGPLGDHPFHCGIIPSFVQQEAMDDQDAGHIRVIGQDLVDPLKGSSVIPQLPAYAQQQDI